MRGQELGAWAYLPDAPLQDDGGKLGPLSGLRFSVKDLIQVANWPTSGSTFASIPPLPRSPLVDQLLHLGAVCVGKTHLHEVALGCLGWNPILGQAQNPLDSTRISGGSSSGAAISVAVGACDFALGTDTGGSIRIPAALCGVAGFKPTSGRYSTEGVLALSPTCDHVGLLARDIRGISDIDRALFPNEPQETPFSSLRFGAWDVSHWVTPEVWERFIECITMLDAQMFSFPDVLKSYDTIVRSEAACVHRKTAGFSAPTQTLLEQAGQILATDYLDAQNQRAVFRNTLEQLFGRFDVLLAPCVPDVAPKTDEDHFALPGGNTPLRTAFLRLTAPYSLLGVPTVSLPLRVGPLSQGIQIIAPWGKDALLLEVACVLERLWK